MLTIRPSLYTLAGRERIQPEIGSACIGSPRFLQGDIGLARLRQSIVREKEDQFHETTNAIHVR